MQRPRSSVCPLQLPISPLGDPPAHLHERIRPPDLPLHHGQEQGWVRPSSVTTGSALGEDKRDETRLTRFPDSFMSIFWKSARIGERLSPYISICCVFMAVRLARLASIFLSLKPGRLGNI